MDSFSGKVVLITGASSGIGAALARALAARGAKVALLARRLPRLQELASEIGKGGGNALAIACDVTKADDLESAIARIRRELGFVDIAVANAGFEVTGLLETLTLEDYRRQFETNVFGVLRTIYATLDDLKKTHGKLVLMGSLLGHLALPGTSAYSMSKFAVAALGQALRLELGAYGISVVLVSPGNVETEIRKVDNRDILHAELDDPIPAWLRTSADHAAADIVTAMSRNRREAVITPLGKAVVFAERHFPTLVSAIVRRAHIRGRSEPTRQRSE